jgi:nucleoside-diphosphate-sugar epimerase
MINQRKKYLIIGANSFVAQHLIDKLKRNNYVLGVYHENKSRLHEDVENVTVNELGKLEMDFDIVYLVSAYVPLTKLDKITREKLFKTNVELVDKVCLKFSKSRIVYCSSVSVYKEKDGIVNEFDAEAGLNEYGISKLWGEKIISQLSDFAIVRLSSIYGPEMKLGTIIPNYIQQSLLMKKVTVFGSGERKQNYLHIHDAVNFLVAAGSSSYSAKFLAVSENSISNKDLANMIAFKLNSNVSFEGRDDSPSFVYDNGFTRQTLDYQCQYSLDEGINSLIKWIREKY